MIIGPYGLALVTNLSTIEAMAEIGIVLLLFIIGLELDPTELMTMKKRVLVFSLVEVAISFAAGTLAGLLLGWSIQESVLLAWVVSVSSTSLVAKMLYERGAAAESSTRLMMSTLIIEDILAVVVLSLLPSLETASSDVWSQAGAWVIRGVLLIALIFALGVYVAPRVIDRISQLDMDLDEAGFLLSISLGFAMAVLSSLLGFSAATGAFLMGLVIRGKRAKFVRGKIRPIRDLFLVIFFVSMGMLVEPSQFLNINVVLLVVGLALVGKYLGSYLGAILSSMREDASDIAIGMTPRGEFSFIIAREAFTTGTARALIYPIAGTVVIITTLVSALAQIPRKRRRRRSVK
jgi:CPA2 family monovalent cation:H+ antiporter-2